MLGKQRLLNQNEVEIRVKPEAEVKKDNLLFNSK